MHRNASTALDDAGIPCALVRLQDRHATLAARIDVLAAQRDRLSGALAWIDEDPARLMLITEEIAARRATVTEDARKEAEGQAWRHANAYHRADRSSAPKSESELVAMSMPSVGQVLSDLMRQST